MLEHSSSLEKLNILNTNISNSVNNNDINLCLSDFVNIIASAAAPMYKKENYDKNANVTESDFFFHINMKTHGITKNVTKKNIVF